MVVKNETFCDICGLSFEGRCVIHAAPILMQFPANMCAVMLNGKGGSEGYKVEYEHVCAFCRAKLTEGVDDVITGLKGGKGHPQNVMYPPDGGNPSVQFGFPGIVPEVHPNDLCPPSTGNTEYPGSIYPPLEYLKKYRLRTFLLYNWLASRLADGAHMENFDYENLIVEFLKKCTDLSEELKGKDDSASENPDEEDSK